MTTLWKAVGLDLTSRDGLRWDVGSVITHLPGTYLSLTTHATETPRERHWPWRLLRVDPIGEVIDSKWYPHKRCALSARVLSEEPAHLALGPMGAHVATLIDRAGRLDSDEARELVNAWDVMWDVTRTTAWDRTTTWDVTPSGVRIAAWGAARVAAVRATQETALTATRCAAEDAVSALMTRDLIEASSGRNSSVSAWTQVEYDVLTGPWRRVIGPCHPDDLPLDTR